jgi:predicted PhzF superfamily epimerase YddE/YHI9
LFEQGLLENSTPGKPAERKPSETIELIGEQGDVIGRKGRVTIQLDVKGSQVLALRIGGRAITVMEGEMVIG